MSQKSKGKYENLGRGILKSRRQVKKNHRADAGEFVHSADLPQEQEVVVRSIIDQNSLDTFLQLAELADAKFVGERQAQLVDNNAQQAKVRIENFDRTHSEQLAVKMNEALDKIGRIPQRVKFTEKMSVAAFDQLERSEFLRWRRQLAELEEMVVNAVMTPYERNPLIWREFWRVFERSDVIVQVLDARNPLLFRCADVEHHAATANKRSVLLLNKADFLTPTQRASWLAYFEKNAPGCVAILFSAKRESDKLRDLARSSKGTHRNTGGSESLDENGTQEEPMQPVDEEDGKKARKSLSQSLSEANELEDDLDGGSADAEHSEMKKSDEVAKQGDCESVKKAEGSENDEEAEEEEDEEEDGENEIEDEDEEVSDEEDEDEESSVSEKGQDKAANDGEKVESDLPGDNETSEDDTHLWSVNDLLRFLASLKPQQEAEGKGGRTESESEAVDERHRHVTIGFIGYPNVGKSSTINALLGRKRVAVSATPGKTKHMQTFKLDLENATEQSEDEETNESLIIADCPGLVFVNAVASRADLVLNGVLSTDQLGDPLPATAAICRLFDRRTLETFYGLEQYLARTASWLPSDLAEPDALLTAIAVSRSLMTAHGVPNRSAAARFILRDFLAGKLLFCHPPPSCDPLVFRPTALLALRAPPPAPQKPAAQLFVRSTEQAFDDRFFARMNDVHIGTRGSCTTANSFRANQTAPVTVRDLSKKHHKGNKRDKLRRVYKHLDN